MKGHVVLYGAGMDFGMLWMEFGCCVMVVLFKRCFFIDFYCSGRGRCVCKVFIMQYRNLNN